MQVPSHGKMMALIMSFLCIGSQTLLNMLSTTLAMPLSSETDKLALLALREKLTNGVPGSLPSWNEPLHFCEWQGVTCSPRHMRVSILHLENQELGGTLGPALGNLTFLRKLGLVNINLHGEIPGEVGRLKRLQILGLINNNLQGEIPREVGRLKRLQILDLSMNNLHGGEVPMELGNCSSLQVIELSYNNLTGKVPAWLGSVMQLSWLHLGVNNLVGSIPPSLGNLSSLGMLSLAWNHLEGSIPHALGRLSNLTHLYLGSNRLSGTVPRSLYNLSNIQDFELAKNQLADTLPSNIHLAFPNLQGFLIAGNQFTGTFPSSISNLSELQEFDISGNRFSGPIPPTLGSLNKLQLFVIDDNSFGNGRAHDLDFLSSLTNCTQLERVYLERNNLGGVLPDLIGNLSSHLNQLSMWNNKISGRIPEGIGNLFNLTELILAGNSFNGTIPDSVGKLKNLVRLNLQENKLYGNIPTVIGNLTELSEVYLGINKLEGIIPFTLRYCIKMQKFVVSENNLSGNIPNQTFGYMEDLVTLDLSMNSLTGPLPSDFGNLDHLSILYLHTNKLNGEVPTTLGAFSALTDFWLKRNFFHGSIPSFLGSLRSLERLDFSINNFSSTIPHELENLTLLNHLNLSFNHLYGEVPSGGVFSNITAISFIGNNDLCGGIPQLKLPPCSKLPSDKHKSSFKKKVIFMTVIGGVLISFIAFIIIYYLRKKPKKFSSSPSLEHKYLRVSYGELHQATNGFSSSNLVGTGSSGSVYKGTLVHFERSIAVKVLNLQTHGASKSFMVECKALGKIKHRNLLNILTCCSSVDYQGKDFKAIVFEFMPHGSLESWLHNKEHNESRNLNLSLVQRVNVALDVAYALDYLHHDSEEAIIHCDIKSSNVLLDDDMVAHLGDFGLARLLHGSTSHSNSEQASSSTIKGTIGYVPPEYGAGGQVSPQGDIYSYGILLLEMFTGKKPTDSMFGEGLSLHKFCNMAIPEGITEIVDARLLIPFDEEERRVTRQQNAKDNIQECLLSIARIGVACSAEFPTQRMGIKDVIKELHATKQKLPN